WTPSPTVAPTITPPSCTDAAYDFTSFMRPRMYGSSESHRLRTSTCPAPGLGTSRSTILKSLSFTHPVGRLASVTWTFFSAIAICSSISLQNMYDAHRADANHVGEPCPCVGLLPLARLAA